MPYATSEGQPLAPVTSEEGKKQLRELGFPAEACLALVHYLLPSAPHKTFLWGDLELPPALLSSKKEKVAFVFKFY